MFVPFTILIQKSIIISKVDFVGDIISKKGKIFMFKKVYIKSIGNAFGCALYVFQYDFCRCFIQSYLFG